MRNGIFDTQKFVKALGEVQKKRGWSIRHIANRFAEFAEISPESAIILQKKVPPPPCANP